MDARDLEAARDGVRLLIAEAQRLKFALDEGDTVTAQRHAMLAKRAATVAGHAGALASTIARSLPDSVGSVERAAWGAGVQGGIDVMRPCDGEVGDRG